MAALGSTITQDGTIDTADTSMANLVYSTGQALMSDRNNLALWHNSNSTNSSFKLLGEEPEVGGPLLGLDIGAHVRYELDDVINLPLFVRAGFHYITSVSGGKQERVLGDAASANADIANLLRANGEDPADYVGGRMANEYSASWLEIPLTIGFKVPLGSEQSYAYAGFGLSFFRGGFSVKLDVDENYANVLATHIDTDALTVNNLSPGAVNETVDFVLGGVGANYLLGAQSTVFSNAVIFLELNSSGSAKTVYSSQMSSTTRQLLTAASSEALYQQDAEWFKRLAFPVVTGGGTVRFGLRYYFY